MPNKNNCICHDSMILKFTTNICIYLKFTTNIYILGQLISSFVDEGLFDQEFSIGIEGILGYSVAFYQTYQGNVNGIQVYNALKLSYDPSSNVYEVLAQDIDVYMVQHLVQLVCVQIWVADVGWLGNGIAGLTYNVQNLGELVEEYCS